MRPLRASASWPYDHLERWHYLSFLNTAIFINRFGLQKITGGDEQTSVATGLALRAREEWPG